MYHINNILKPEDNKMEMLSNILTVIDDFVWGPVMLVMLVGTGIFLTIRLKFMPWRNLGYAIRLTLSKESRKSSKGEGDISPFSALTTALAATIGTGNIVGVATAMVSGGPGALVWMWISACFGLSSKFSECMLAIKYREVNENGEMSGGPMYTMQKGFKNKKVGKILGWLFALFAVIASFGIGNLTQANSISSSLESTFSIPVWVTGVILTVFALIIIVGGIQKISKVSSVVVPLMAIFYILAGMIVIIGNIANLPAGIAMIFKMAFSVKAVGGGLCGTITAAIMNSMRYGVSRGCFSNEAGMGSAAITAAAATTDNAVKQGYINMTGTFWDTIVVCTITGLCIASSGVLGQTEVKYHGVYTLNGNEVVVEYMDGDKQVTESYEYKAYDNKIELLSEKGEVVNALAPLGESADINTLNGEYTDAAGNHYTYFNGAYTFEEVIKGAPLTILAFESVLGELGGWLVSIGIVLFAFSTILGWEYHGEKAFEYLFQSPKYTMIYRIFFSLIVYIGATLAIDIVWSFSDIANALMAVPNLISLIALSGVIAKEVQEFEKIKKKA